MIATARFALSALLIPAAFMSAADTGLLTLVMPDAKILSGLSVEQSKASPFGQYVLSQMQPDDQNFQTFMAATGFDPRRDVREILVASLASKDQAKGNLVLARGTFDPAKIAAFAQTSGSVVTSFQGVNILSDARAKTNGIAFLDNTIAIAGDTDLVKAAIQRRQAATALPAATVAKVQEISAKNDAWFVSLVPVSQLIPTGPSDVNINGQIQPNMLQGIQSAAGGVRFGSNILVSAEATTRSPQDATALADVVRFLVNMAQMQNKGDAQEFATILNTLTLQTTNNLMSMSVTVPESQIEQFVHTPHRAARTRKSAYVRK